MISKDKCYNIFKSYKGPFKKYVSYIPFSNTESVSNMKTCCFKIRKMWSVCIFKYEFYLFLNQAARHSERYFLYNYLFLS